VRSEALDHISRRLAEMVDENAAIIAAEGGKPLKWAKVEATRAASTFRWASEVLRHGDDELTRLDTEASFKGRLGLLRRFPYGPVLGITPFNFPLNLVAHKVAPALAVGAPIVVKPASATPIGSLVLAELFDETDLPKGMYQVLPVNSKVADGMARDARFRKISFTGSADIGWYLKSLDPKKRVTLELGGNAGVIVHSDADLDLAAARIAFGSYYQAGQSCISVQRILVASEVYDDFAVRLTKEVENLKTGDPMDPTVDVGPVIQKGEVDRISSWVQEAVAQGAEILTGGKSEGPFYYPTLLSQTTPDMKVRCEEIFGPVATITPYETFEEALAEVNNSKFGLQAGVFTNDLNRAFLAHRTLDVGGVIINDVSAFRADQMPYGGSKESGFGREGLRFAMEEMTEPRIMVLNVPL
jgi:aldehyde dehydrogenase (NAD+)